MTSEHDEFSAALAKITTQHHRDDGWWKFARLILYFAGGSPRDVELAIILCRFLGTSDTGSEVAKQKKEISRRKRVAVLKKEQLQC